MPVAAAPLIAAGISGLSALGQGISSIFTAKKRKKAERELESEVNKMKVPESIMDYYNKAYNKYSPNAYQSAEYNQQMRNVLANQASGIGALQNRRSALAGIPSIVQGTNVAAGRAAAGAEATQRANLAQLGGAASSKAQQENLIRQAKLNIKAQKASALAGTQNIQRQGAFNALGNAAKLAMYAGGGEGGGDGFGKFTELPGATVTRA